MVLYTTTKFLRDLFLAVPSVKTITSETEDNIDWYSTTIFPLININLVSSTPLEQVHRISYNINIFQQRDSVPKLQTERFLGDNMIDNLDETYTIATIMANKLRSFYNEQGIELISMTDVQFLKKVRSKELDGCWFNVILEVPNVTEC